MQTSLETYVTLLVVALLLIGLEIFLPGGVFGVFGVLFFLAAIVVGFTTFGAQGGMVSALCLFVAAVVTMILWLKYFPRTGVGRRLSLQRDGSDFKATGTDLERLVGCEGVAQSSLRPAGIALIDGRRLDVVAEAGYVDAGARVRVIRVEGVRVVVRPVPAAS